LRERTLGRSGITISEIGFGCGNGAALMISDDAEAQRAAVERALERGVTYFDTAPIYGAFRSELTLGRALRALDAKPHVATKIALELSDLDDIPAAVVASVEGSLERIQRDELDVVYLHNRVGSARAPQADLGVGALLTVEDVLGPKGVVAGLESLRKRGLVKTFGCCSYGGEATELERVIDSDFFDTMLVHYSMLNQTLRRGPRNAAWARRFCACSKRDCSLPIRANSRATRASATRNTVTRSSSCARATKRSCRPRSGSR
jgi:aryl-alcohol dehydrogenase-like predicted oxidoreductase